MKTSSEASRVPPEIAITAGTIIKRGRPTQMRPRTPVEIAQLVGATGYMTPERGQRITDFVREHTLSSVLELGFAHGVSTCYLASAVASERGGRVVSIDRESARHAKPSAEDLLARCGCRDSVTLYYEKTSYTWRLMKFLEEPTRPSFDLCFIDGAHSWDTDGFAFFLADRMLTPGGWFIFDDLDWTYATSPTLRRTRLVQEMPDDERTTAQIRKIYELLVRQHPNYHNFRVLDGWVYAQKLGSDQDVSQPRTEVVYVQSILDRVWSVLKKGRRGRG